MERNVTPLSELMTILEKTSSDSLAWNIQKITQGDKAKSIAFLNAHGLNTAYHQSEFSNFLRGCDYLLRDGVGIKWALQFLGFPAGKNLNGTDLIPKILQQNAEKKIAIFGASMEALEGTRDKLNANGIKNIVALEHGFHEFSAYLDACDRTKPDIVILCMGMPKQELLAAELVEKQKTRLVVCGGGWADFYSGYKKRAPLWVQKLSLEWAHRLWCEPRRLGKRYTIDIISFFILLIRIKIFSNGKIT